MQKQEMKALALAVAKGTIYESDAESHLDKAERHAGGRPKGVKNSGPDRLERAVMALSARLAGVDKGAFIRVGKMMFSARRKAEAPNISEAERRDYLEVAEEARQFIREVNEQINPEDREDSDFRVAELLALRNISVQRLAEVESRLLMRMAVMLAVGQVKRATRLRRSLKAVRERRERREAIHELKEEADVVKYHIRYESRPGGSTNTTPVKGSSGKSGYKSMGEPIVERSLSTGPVKLWGADVTAAVQQDLGFEAAPRLRQKGRCKLEPIRLLEEHVVHYSDTGKEIKLIGAGDGRNGLSMHNVGSEFAPEPTIAQLRQAKLEGWNGEFGKSLKWIPPIQGGLAYEPDGRRTQIFTAPAEFRYWAVYRSELKIISGGVIHVNAACVRPEPDRDMDCMWPTPLQAVRDKQIEVVPCRYAAPPFTLPAIRRTGTIKINGELQRWEWTFQPAASLPRGEGELPAGAYATKWRKQLMPVQIGIMFQRALGQITNEQANKALTKAKRWNKPSGLLAQCGVDGSLPRINGLTPLARRWLPLPILWPPDGVEIILPQPSLHIDRSMDVAGKGSVVWAEDGEPLRGTVEWGKRRWPLHRCHADHWREPEKKPDRAPGWDVLPILHPPCGFEVLFPDLMAWKHVTERS